ncbi:DMT family transporter [Rhodosalinus sp. 5P4]|uniref:DMT family transporter n=1 Tax=Rhodosalinus sp. 5P4 TaxID=3239196 RepID=UPI003526BE38
MTSSDYAKGLAITLAGVIVISPDTLLIRLIDAGAWTQTFWRGTLSGALILGVYLALTGARGLRSLLRAGPTGLGIAVAYGIGNIAFVYSATNTLVANTLFILSTSPVFAALIARFVLGETVGRRTWITIAATLVGIAVIAAGSAKGGGATGSLAGDAAALVAAVCLAVVFSLARATRSSGSAVPFTGLGALAAGLFAGLVAPGVAVPAPDRIWMAAMGLFVVPVAFACLATGPRYLPAADVSLIMLLEAILGPLLVWAIVDEAPGPWTLAGGAMVLGALAISNWIGLRRSRRLRAARSAG